MLGSNSRIVEGETGTFMLLQTFLSSSVIECLFFSSFEVGIIARLPLSEELLRRRWQLGFEAALVWRFDDFRLVLEDDGTCFRGEPDEKIFEIWSFGTTLGVLFFGFFEDDTEFGCFGLLENL